MENEVINAIERWFSDKVPPEAEQEMSILLAGYTTMDMMGSFKTFEEKMKHLTVLIVCIFNLGRAHPHESYLVGEK